MLTLNTRAWNLLILVVKFILTIFFLTFIPHKVLLTLFIELLSLVFDRFPCQCPADLRVMLNTARMGFYHTLCFSHPLRVSLCPLQCQQFLFYSLNHFREKKIVHPQISKVLGLIFLFIVSVRPRVAQGISLWVFAVCQRGDVRGLCQMIAALTRK